MTSTEEPDIAAAPFASRTALLFTVGGTALAAAALVLMLRAGVSPAVRFVVLATPFLAVTWWLLSPYFRDEVASDGFTVSIAEAAGRQQSTSTSPGDRGQQGAGTAAGDPADTAQRAATAATSAAPAATSAPADQAPAADAAAPQLRGVGSFVGLAGHDGSGDAAVFRLPDGSEVLRFERFDIDNGPDLRVYLVPGADQTDPGAGAVYLGALRGNVGDQTYAIPAGTQLSGPVTVLVWCEAFDVEFVAATVALR